MNLCPIRFKTGMGHSVYTKLTLFLVSSSSIIFKNENTTYIRRITLSIFQFKTANPILNTIKTLYRKKTKYTILIQIYKLIFNVIIDNKYLNNYNYSLTYLFSV